jgi:hypothetical protein
MCARNGGSSVNTEYFPNPNILGKGRYTVLYAKFREPNTQYRVQQGIVKVPAK